MIGEYGVFEIIFSVWYILYEEWFDDFKFSSEVLYFKVILFCLDEIEVIWYRVDKLDEVKWLIILCY